MRLLKDLSISSINAGFVTVLVGFTSSVVIVFQAAQALGASPEELGSWMLALGLGMGVPGIALSLYYRIPIAAAWSTAGAAMLITSAAGVSMPEAVGAFVVTGLLIAVTGFSGWFERMIGKIPMSLAGGMLSGVLLRFGLGAFAAGKTEPFLILTMFVAYLLARRFVPRYAVLLALLVGTALAGMQGSLRFDAIEMHVAQPVFVMPEFSWHGLVGVAIPLFVVTMASQNVPAVAVLRSSGYDAKVSPLIGWLGVANFILAPFGAFALNLATITAAICVSREAHEDPQRRYVAAVAAGFFYILVGLFGTAVASVFAAFPQELIAGIAGFALLGTMVNGLVLVVQTPADREAAMVSFLLTASGLTLGGVGSAFWGLLAGVFALVVLRRKEAQTPPKPVVVAAQPAVSRSLGEVVN